MNGCVASWNSISEFPICDFQAAVNGRLRVHQTLDPTSTQRTVPQLYWCSYFHKCLPRGCAGYFFPVFVSRNESITIDWSTFP